MKNILFVHSVGELGGAERMSLSLMENLPKSEFTCHLATPADGEFVTRAKSTGAKSVFYEDIQPSFSSPFKTLKNTLQWRRIITRLKPDIIHTADLLSTRAIAGEAAKSGIPVIFHAHFPFSAEFAKWALKKAPSKIVFCSNDLLNCHQDVLEKYCPQTRLDVIHNGVDVNLFTPSFVSNTFPKVGIVANLQERKGHKEFLEMAALVKAQGLDAEFHIIGGDIMQEPREPLLRKLACELNISEIITFHGQVSDVRPLVSNLDVLVCASYEEAFPVSILEAMALKKAIVSTNVNGIPEAIEHRKSGLLVRPHSGEELAKMVIEILSNKNLKETLSNNALKRVKSNFSVETYISAWANHYQNC